MNLTWKKQLNHEEHNENNENNETTNATKNKNSNPEHFRRARCGQHF
jgi:hypothetical protein